MAGFFGSSGRAMGFGVGGQKPQPQMGGGNGGSFAQKQPMMNSQPPNAGMRAMAQGMASAGGGMQQRPQPMVQPQRPQMQQRPMQPAQQQNPMQQRASPQQSPGIGPRMGGAIAPVSGGMNGMGIQAPGGGGGMQRWRPGGMSGGMNRPQQGNDPYYNASLPGTRAGMDFNSDGPSFGDDPSGIGNRLNPTADASRPFTQRGTSGGYLDGVGITIGGGRSITPQQYQAQIAQAKAAGIPESYIADFLQRNPGDSNRLLESYQSEDGGKYKDQMISAQQTPWSQFATGAVGTSFTGDNQGGGQNPGIGPRPGRGWGGYNHWGGGGDGWNRYPQMQDKQIYY